jgi:hypothetical protein
MMSEIGDTLLWSVIVPGIVGLGGAFSLGLVFGWLIWGQK